jgi:uncharacterized membrane protein
VKDLLDAFVGEKKKFNKPVLVEINKENQLYQIGFITQADLKDLGLQDMVSVYLPHSYAVSGLHYILHTFECFRNNRYEIYCIRRRKRIEGK